MEITIKIVKKGHRLFAGEYIAKHETGDVNGRLVAGTLQKVWDSCFTAADRHISTYQQFCEPDFSQPGVEPSPEPEPKLEQQTLRAPGMAGINKKRLPHLKTKRKAVVQFIASCDGADVSLSQLASRFVGQDADAPFSSNGQLAVYLEAMREDGILHREFRDGSSHYRLNTSHAGVALVLERLDGQKRDASTAGSPDQGADVDQAPQGNVGLFGETFHDDGPPFIRHVHGANVVIQHRGQTVVG